MSSVPPHDLRASLGVSRAKLARLLGVTEMTLIRWEAGEQTAPRGLPLLILQTLALARRQVPVQDLARLVIEGGTNPGPALQKLFSLAYPPTTAASGSTTRRRS